ncbi:TPA: response regulator [Vibrio vulnificus]|nr:response regulator [Vibrio vulnificus]
MAKHNFSQLKVLIIDDAPVVITSLRGMLLKLGFSEANIQFSKSPKSAVFKANREKFDIFICDYNFGKGMNGKQIFEELKHYKALKSDAVFILVTGESSAFIVHSILELKPDEYILKPFNIGILQTRLENAVLRKQVLKNLYAAERAGDSQAGLVLCEELEPFHPEYYFLIQKFRGSFLTRLKLFEEAKKVYEQTLEKKELDWAKVGLANALRHTGKMTEATKLVHELVSSMPSNTTVRVEAANLSLMNSDVPDAISHLKVASSIVPGNSERELVIANLCLSEGDTRSALQRFRLYSEVNKETFRNNHFMRMNHIRSLLYALNDAEPLERIRWLKEAKSLFKQAYDCSLDEELDSQFQLIAAHIAIEEKQYRVAVEILNQLYRTKPFEHFYDRYHFTWLLNAMGFDSEFSHCIVWCKESLLGGEMETILASKTAMARALERQGQEKVEWLEEQYKALIEHKQDIEKLYEIYAQILARSPTLRTVCTKIITILSRYWPKRSETTAIEEIHVIMKQCDVTIRQLMSEEEREKIQYETLWEKAKQQHERQYMVTEPA